VIANNCYFPIEIGCSTVENLKRERKEMSSALTIAPNKVFNVPISWMLDNVCILYKRLEDNKSSNDILFYEITSCLMKNKDKSNIPFKSSLFSHEKTADKNTHFSLDLHAFKCKPLQLDMPLQFLISMNPPMCYKNLLFADVSLESENGEHVLKLAPEKYEYMYDLVHSDNKPNSQDKQGSQKY